MDESITSGREGMEDLEGWRTTGKREGKVDGPVASVHSMSTALTSNISETKQEIRLLGERMSRLEKVSNGNSNGGSKIRLREVIALAAALTGAGGSATLWQRYTEVAARLDYMQHHVQDQVQGQGQGQSSAQPQTNR